MKKLIVIIIVVLILGLTAVAGFYYFNRSSKDVVSPADTTGSAVKTGGKCESQYQSLLSLYGQNFDDCKVDITKASDCSKMPDDSAAAKQKNVVIIFDSSGSMAGVVNGKKKIDIAKSAVENFVGTLDSSTKIDIIVYGHKGSNRASDKNISCSSIDEVYYMDKIKPDVVKEKLATFQPTGWTPIAGSLEKAKGILSQYPKESNDNMIILVSDGQETCGGDPVAKAKELLASDFKVATNVIGFDVAGEEEKKLQAISGGGGGKYFSVHNEQEFADAFKENKNFMAGFDCYMSQSNVWLGNELDVTFKRGDCLHRLNMDEKHEIELNTNLGNDGVADDCKSYILEAYSKRYEQIKNDIETAYSQSKAQTDQEKNKLENIKNTLDAGEGVFQ